MFKAHISARKLYEALGIKGRYLPTRFSGRFENFLVYAYDHKTVLGSLTIIVYPSRRSHSASCSGKHRIGTLCPSCKTEVSLWKLREHYGSAKCFKAALLRDKAEGADTVPPE